jgi:acyl dehydratase
VKRLGRRAAAEANGGGLSGRELEVMRLVAVGHTNREIATRLFLSPRTSRHARAEHPAKALLPLARRGRPQGRRAGPAHVTGSGVVRQVGEKAARKRTIRERDIELFTELTGDRNPLHYDEEAASRSRFAGIIVQGGVTTGLLNAVVAETCPAPAASSCTWTGASRRRSVPVTRSRPRSRCWSARDKPVTKLRTTITNQDGRLVLDGSALV